MRASGALGTVGAVGPIGAEEAAIWLYQGLSVTPTPGYGTGDMVAGVGAVQQAFAHHTCGHASSGNVLAVAPERRTARVRVSVR